MSVGERLRDKRASSKLSLAFLPPSFRHTLFKFQRQGIRYGISKEGRCLIGDEMGLGKTLQAIAIAYYYKDEWPLLIIAPASLCFQWIEALEDWLPDIVPGRIHLVRGFSDLNSLLGSEISIISYGMLSYGRHDLLASILKKRGFGVAILDESHYIKNHKSKRTQKAREALSSIRRIILLTGTPSLARPEELYSQVCLLQPRLFGSFIDYAKRYCNGHYVVEYAAGGRPFNKFNTKGASNLPELHDKLVSNVMIRRTKDQVLSQLPPKRRQRITFEIPVDSKYKKEVDDGYENLVHKLRRKEGDLPLRTSDINMALVQLYTVTSLAKAGAVQQFILDLLDGMLNKFLVFCYHKSMIQAVEEVLYAKEVRHITISGDVPKEQRGQLVHRFQSDSEIRVAVLSILAASTGFTMTAADHIVFAELHWTPGVLLQAEDRCHRIGQASAVQVYYLVARNTIDEILWSMLRRKIDVTSITLDGKTGSLDVENESAGKGEFLSMVSTWEPAYQLPEDCIENLFKEEDRDLDSGQQDIRKMLSSGRGRKARKKRVATDEPSQISGNIVVVSSSDDDDFKPLCKKKQTRATARSTLTAEISEFAEAGCSSVPNLACGKDAAADSKSIFDSAAVAPIASGETIHPAYLSEVSHVGKALCSPGTSSFVAPESRVPCTSNATGTTWTSTVESTSSSFINGLTTMETVSCCSVCELYGAACKCVRNMNAIEQRGSSSSFEYCLSTSLAAMPQPHWAVDDLNDAALPIQLSCPAVSHLSIAPRQYHKEASESSCDSGQSDGGCKSAPREGIVAGEFKLGQSFSDSEEGPSWSCNTCTFLNHSAVLQCEICASEKMSNSSNDVSGSVLTRSCSGPLTGSPSLNSAFASEFLCYALPPSVSSGCSSEAIGQDAVREQRNSLRQSSQLGNLSDDSDSRVSEFASCDDEVPSAALFRSRALDFLATLTKDNSEESAAEKYARKTETDVQRDMCNPAIVETPRIAFLHQGEAPGRSDGMQVKPDADLPCFDNDDSLILPSDGRVADDSGTVQCWECFGVNPSQSSLCKFCCSELHSAKTAEEPSRLVDSAHCSSEMRDVASEGGLVRLSDDCDVPSQVSTSSSSECDGCEEEEEVDQSKIEDMKFCLSQYTDKVYVFTKDKHYLGLRFAWKDVVSKEIEKLPLRLRLPENLKQIIRFVNEWKSMSLVKQSLVQKYCGIFQTPLVEYEERRGLVRTNSRKRHISKTDDFAKARGVASDIGGHVVLLRHATKRPTTAIKVTPSSSCEENADILSMQRNHSDSDGIRTSCADGPDDDFTAVPQAVDQSGKPLCLYCSQAITGLRAGLWEARFCSRICRSEFLVRRNQGRGGVREQLFEVEQGVCQMCGVDAHALFEQLKATPAEMRKAVLENSRYSKLPITQLNKMVTKPKQGQFWEADHIKPVAEGGGECGLDNFRTLCTPCHREATKDLHSRLAKKRSLKRAQVNRNRDIATFFPPT